MIEKAREAEVLRLFHAEKWTVGTIAGQLRLHHSTVRRVLAQSGAGPAPPPRRSKAEPFVPLIIETLKQYPLLRASRLFEMARERGYTGGPDHFRAIVAEHRPRPVAEAYQRLRTLPGEQAQVDWAHFGKLTIGGASRPLMGFVMVLSWSRQIFLRFFASAQMAAFLEGHVEAFSFFGGVPRVLLYDNLKSAVLERAGEAIRFHPTLLELAGHYRFQPRPVAPARGNEKGRVERAIRYVRDSFFAARKHDGLDDLNAQALTWTTTIAAARPCPEDRTRTVRDVFREERALLLPVPADEFPAEEHQQAHVGKTPYVRFDLNDYSVPHTHVKRTLALVASSTRVRVVDGTEVIATHARSYDRAQQIEDPAHLAALADHKRAAGKHRAIDQLHHALPHSRELLRIIAQRGGNIGGTTQGLLRLLAANSASDLDAAIAAALLGGAPHLGAVHQLLDRARAARGEPPPVSVPLPPDPRLRTLTVKPHALSTYDSLRNDDTDDT